MTLCIIYVDRFVDKLAVFVDKIFEFANDLQIQNLCRTSQVKTLDSLFVYLFTVKPEYLTDIMFDFILLKTYHNTILLLYKYTRGRFTF